jgi:membrane protease YdiL (CAAX protease family)
MHMNGFDNADGRVWGPWVTAGFGLVIGAVFMVTQTVVGVFFVAAMVSSDSKQEALKLAQDLITNGLFIALATFATSVVCICLVLLFVKLRRGAPIAEYLATGPISVKTLLALLGVCAGFILLSDGLTLLLGRATIPQFMVDIYRTSHYPPLLGVALTLGGPAFEEAFFRGFLLEGFRRSRIGNTGAVVLTALLWTAIHLQYGLYELAIIFALGLLLAIARVKTGSIWSCFVMHAFFNLVSMMETAVYAGPLLG